MRFLTLEEVAGMHELLLRRDGGEPGILSLGLLEAALDRCRHGPFPRPPDLALRAALLMRGIAQDHPFADGNKRTGLEAVDTFLRDNGAPLRWLPGDAMGFALGVAQGMELQDIASELRRRMRNLKEPAEGDAEP